MKHLFEFHSFINEGNLTKTFDPVKDIDLLMPKEREISPEFTPNSPDWAPIVKLTELNASKLLDIYVYTRPIVANYEDLRNGTYDDVSALPSHKKTRLEDGTIVPKIKPLSGVTYNVLNDNTIKLTFPAVSLSIDERVFIYIPCKKLVNPQSGYTGATLQSFDRPGRGVSGDDSVWFHHESSGVTNPMKGYPKGKPVPGKVYTGTLKRNVPGGILNFIIDMTKTSGYVLFDDGYELEEAKRLRSGGVWGEDQ